LIAIVDYNMGNIGSVRNMLTKLGVASELTRDPERIRVADKLILPGVGAFDTGMSELDAAGLRGLLDELVLVERKPVLGICLGMQLMCRRSDEGQRAGLGWVDAQVRRFEVPTLKVPHMGWNLVEVCRESPLIHALPEQSRFYFVHSYHVECTRSEDVVLRSEYGGAVVAGFETGNVYGVQFHPEKSHRFGMHLLRNFAERC
jgi:glutamine amidotransferase